MCIRTYEAYFVKSWRPLYMFWSVSLWKKSNNNNNIHPSRVFAIFPHTRVCTQIIINYVHLYGCGTYIFVIFSKRRTMRRPAMKYNIPPWAHCRSRRTVATLERCSGGTRNRRVNRVHFQRSNDVRNRNDRIYNTRTHSFTTDPWRARVAHTQYSTRVMVYGRGVRRVRYYGVYHPSDVAAAANGRKIHFASFGNSLRHGSNAQPPGGSGRKRTTVDRYIIRVYVMPARTIIGRYRARDGDAEENKTKSKKKKNNNEIK